MITSIAHAAGLVALAEMGDRSQLVCIALAARHPGPAVLAGAVLAFSLMNTVSVTAGAFLNQWLPPSVVVTGSGLLMLAFAAWTGLDDDDDDAEVDQRHLDARPVLGSMFALIASELGDKTQLAVGGLSASGDPLAVWTGATLALIGTSALGILAGQALTDVVPARVLRIASAGFFALTGIWMLARPWW